MISSEELSSLTKNSIDHVIVIVVENNYTSLPPYILHFGHKSGPQLQLQLQLQFNLTTMFLQTFKSYITLFFASYVNVLIVTIYACLTPPGINKS